MRIRGLAYRTRPNSPAQKDEKREKGTGERKEKRHRKKKREVAQIAEHRDIMMRGCNVAQTELEMTKEAQEGNK